MIKPFEIIGKIYRIVNKIKYSILKILFQLFSALSEAQKFIRSIVHTL